MVDRHGKDYGRSVERRAKKKKCSGESGRKENDFMYTNQAESIAELNAEISARPTMGTIKDRKNV